MKTYQLEDGSTLFVDGESLSVQTGIAKPFSVTHQEAVPMLLALLDVFLMKEIVRNELQAIQSLEKLKEMGVRSNVLVILQAFKGLNSTKGRECLLPVFK
jgi:hypothetical protein